MELNTTARKVIKAYGGEQLWLNAKMVDVELSAWGWAFRLKWQRPFKPLRAQIRVDEPVVRFSPIDRAGNTACLEGNSVKIIDAEGRVLSHRPNPRTFFPYGRRLFWWDTLDQAYFSGYALWNYLTFPRLLMRSDIKWSEVSEGTLEAQFPPDIPTHSTIQRFHLDPETWLLRQHDYTAEVFGGWAKAAHMILAHEHSGSLPYACRRAVYPRLANGKPRPFPLLVGIEVHRWELR